MSDAKKSMKEKGLNTSVLKSLPSNGNIFPTLENSPTIKALSIHSFDENDNPYGRPPDACMEELHLFRAK